MKFLKWLIIDIWTPVNIRIGIVYGFVAQFKFLAELVVYASAGYYLWFKVLPSHKMLLISFVIFVISSVGLGEILIRWNIPHKMNEKGNRLNPQLDKINEIYEILKQRQ